MGDLVSLQIRFATGELLLLEGAGIIRWVRHEDEDGLASGCGVEFEALSAEARKMILHLTESMKTKPYIHKG